MLLAPFNLQFAAIIELYIVMFGHNRKDEQVTIRHLLLNPSLVLASTDGSSKAWHCSVVHAMCSTTLRNVLYGMPGLYSLVHCSD